MLGSPLVGTTTRSSAQDSMYSVVSNSGPVSHEGIFSRAFTI